MAKTNSQLRTEALALLKNRWVDPIIFTFVYMLILSIFSFTPRLSYFVIFISIPLVYGLIISFLHFWRKGAMPSLMGLFMGFRDYIRIFSTLLLSAIYIFLWSLLLIVPGIIKSYSYAMTPYILADEPELSTNGAIERSMAMMRGHKRKLFYMNLNFLAWSLLAIPTLGVALLWIYPYMQTTMAAFYEDLKSGYITSVEQ